MLRKFDSLRPLMAIALWLAIVAVGVGMAAYRAGEPPFWDALSYVEKSKNFWEMIAKGPWENPLDLYPTIRPPGVIAVAFPFGFSENYLRFYARMVFVPIALLALAVIIAGWQTGRSSTSKAVLVSSALVLAGMPILYQFQPNDALRSQGNWGLVDGLLAGVAAFATAAAIGSVRLQSVAWAAVAAVAAAYGLFVKPAGLILMGLVGVAWLFLALDSIGWNPRRLGSDKKFLRYILTSLAIAGIVYGGTLHAAFTSAYYAPENIEFGLRNLRIFRDELTYSIDAGLVAVLLHHSSGWPVLLGIAVGIAAAVVHRQYLAAAMAIITLVVGVWFWIFTTNIGDVRYFMPFVAVAFVLTVPAILSIAEHARPQLATGIAGVAATPAVLTTLLLFVPSPPVWLQSQLGINLFTDFYRAEVGQAKRLMADLANARRPLSQIYIFDISPVTRSFGAVPDYYNAIFHREPYLRTILPVDWQRGLSYRFDEIVASDFIGFEPITDPARRAGILAKTTIDDYPDQAVHMAAWASTIGPDEGVEVVSETRLRLLRITDPAKLTAALQRFAVGYTWPKPFQDNNAPHWWTAQTP